MKKINKESCLIIAICLLPVLVAILCLMIKVETFQNIIPIWSDEVNYYHIIESMIDYGAPLGYNGYNGSTAIFSTYGFHGVVILLPYYLFCLCFGLHSYSIALCNIVLVILALFIFQSMNKMEWKKLLALGIIASFSPMVMTFFTINMVEGVNIFFAITIAGGFLRLVKNPSKKVAYVLLLIIILATLSKVTWGVCIFPWLMIQVKGNVIKRSFISFSTTIVFVIVNYIVFSLVSAPYFESQITVLLNLIKVKGFSGIFDIILLFIRNLYIPFALGLKHDSLLLVITTITFIAMIVFVAYTMLKYIILLTKYKDGYEWSKNDIITMIGVWLFISTYLGIALLYTASLVMLRTLYPIFVCCLILFVYAYEKKACYATISCITIASYIIIAVTDIYYDPRYFKTPEYAEMVGNQRNYLREAITIDTDGEAWSNTIAATFDVPMSYWLGATSGTGYNLYKDIPTDLKSIKAKYVLVMSSNKTLIDSLLENGYHIYSGDVFTRILVK